MASRFAVQDGEIIDFETGEPIPPDVFDQVATLDEQDDVTAQLDREFDPSDDGLDPVAPPAPVPGALPSSRPTTSPRTSTGPSLDEFMVAAKEDNPDHSERELRQYWAQTYNDIDPKTLPTKDVFLQGAREDNPTLSTRELTRYWEEHYGDFGALVVAEPERDFMRGAETAVKQLPQLASGLEAGIGAAGEYAFGEGGLSTAIKEHGIKGYTEQSAKIEQGARPSDSATTAYEMATKGDPGALADFIQYGLGYMAVQGVEMLATGGMGYAVGKLGAQGAAKLVAEKMIAKEAARLSAQSGATQVSEAITKQAVANVAGKIGQTTALATTAVGMEGGEIFGDLTAEAAKEGRTLDGEQLAKAFGATVAAGALEFVGDKIGFDLMVGKSPVGRLAREATGLGGRAARGAIQGATGAVAEGGTEFGQTLIEQAGKGKDPFSDASIREAVDSAALGVVGGTAMGAGSGALRGAQSPEPDKWIDQAVEDVAEGRDVRLETEWAPAAAATHSIDDILDAPDVDTAIAHAEAMVSAAPGSASVIPEAIAPTTHTLPIPRELVGAPEQPLQPSSDLYQRAAIAAERARLVAGQTRANQGIRMPEPAQPIENIQGVQGTQAMPGIASDIPRGTIGTSPVEAVPIQAQPEKPLERAADKAYPSVNDIHAIADSRGIVWDDDAKFMAFTEQITGKQHLDALEPAERLTMANALQSVEQPPPMPSQGRPTPELETPSVDLPSPAVQTTQPGPETAPNVVRTFSVSFLKAATSEIDRDVFQDGVSKTVQREGQRLLTAVKNGDFATIEKIRSQYETNASHSQGGGGSGPGKVKSSTRGVPTIVRVALAAISKQAIQAEKANLKKRPLAEQPSESYRILPAKTREKFEAAWTGSEQGDRPSVRTMKEWLSLNNKTLRAEFERRAGVKLPKALAATNAAVEEYFKKVVPTGEDIAPVPSEAQPEQVTNTIENVPTAPNERAQLGIDIPAPTIGEAPIVRREVDTATAATEAPLFSKDAQTPQAEQTALPEPAPNVTPTPVTINYASIPAGTMVQIKGIRASTGDEITVQEDAAVALRDLDVSLKKYQQLMECLGR